MDAIIMMPGASSRIIDRYCFLLSLLETKSHSLSAKVKVIYTSEDTFVYEGIEIKIIPTYYNKVAFTFYHVELLDYKVLVNSWIYDKGDHWPTVRIIADALFRGGPYKVRGISIA